MGYGLSRASFTVEIIQWDIVFMNSILIVKPVAMIHASASLQTGHFKDKHWSSQCKPGEFCVQYIAYVIC